jgi:hypothetical protein
MTATITVRDFLTTHPQSTIPEIMEHTGLARSSVRNALLALPVYEEPYWPRKFSLPVEVDGEPVAPTIKPQAVDVKEAGPRWNNARQRIAPALQNLDLTEVDYGFAVETFKQAASALLGMAQALEIVGDAPEWRQEIGL